MEREQKKPEQLTSDQKIEQLSQGLLEWKANYGNEIQVSARLQAQLMHTQKQVKLLQAEVEKLKSKFEKEEDD